VIKICHVPDWTSTDIFYTKYIEKIYSLYNSNKITAVPFHKNADFVVVTNCVGNRGSVKEKDLNLKKVILHQYEPPERHKMWGKWADKAYLDNTIYKFFDMERNRPIVFPYYDVKGECFKPCATIPNKEERQDRLCFITSLWNTYSGHALRLRLLDAMHDSNFDYDLYGGKRYSCVHKNISAYKQWKDKDIPNKHDVLNTYKYTLVIENTFEGNWFSEKFWDAIISECLPIYWGAPNLEKFIPEKSFIRLKENSTPQDIMGTIEKAIKDKEWEHRIEHIRAAKRLLLQKYDVIHTLEDILK